MADHKCPSSAVRKGSVIELPQPVNPLLNVGSKNVSYYTPEQVIPSGTAIPDENGAPLPKLFQPLKLRSITLQNRIMVSPMCQYSALDGHLTDWHLTHIGGIISRGPGLTIMEATAVSAEGRISPEDSGLWKDSQTEPIKRVVDFAHSQNQKICVQLAHAGRKASTVAPWIDRKAAAPSDTRGWPNEVVSVSDVPFDEHTCVPRTMTLEDIALHKQKWVDAAKRAVQAGFDAIEIHAGHGYLLHASLSAAVNRLPLPYSGTLENRMRLLLEITELVRATIPEDMPLLVRIPGEDWVPKSMNGWEISQAIPLSLALADLGVDFLDICSAGLMSEQKVISGPGYQAPFARDIKKALQNAGKNEKTVVGTVGMITSGVQAQKLLDDGWADAILVARAFIKSPALVWEWAAELGLKVRLANQIGWGFGQHPGGGVGGGHAKAARG